jgi:hypothetical protein
MTAAGRHRESLKNPAKTIEEYLEMLEREGLALTVAVLRDYMTDDDALSFLASL